MVMIAARLAKQNYTAPKIVQELEEVKKLLHCSFIIKNTDTMSRRGLISPFLNNILNTLWLRPVLKGKDDKLGASRFFLGSEKQCYEKYIKKEFKNNPHVDKDFVFITYAGMAEEDLLWIEELPEVPQDMLEDAYGAMSEIVETLDYELARMVVEQLKEYKLPPEDDDRFKRIQTRLSQMDWDGIKNILAEKG
ncbi:MAG: DegV family protein [Lachnospiraceae bacterium]|nr:DegV family protein [Lachnospiraceae bacterium]